MSQVKCLAGIAGQLGIALTFFRTRALLVLDCSEVQTSVKGVARGGLREREHKTAELAGQAWCRGDGFHRLIGILRICELCHGPGKQKGRPSGVALFVVPVARLLGW